MPQKDLNRALPWLRLYTRTVDDDKLRLLAFEDRWHFIAVLCCKGANIISPDCDPELLERKLSVKLGLSVRELGEVKRRLMEVGLITNSWEPVAWDSCQFKSDHDGAERKKRSREAKRAGAF